MSEDEKLKVDEQVVMQLVNTAATMSEMLSKLTDTHDAQGERLSFFREELKAVRDSLRRIAKVLLEGNGEKPIIARIAIVEEKINYLENQAKERREEERLSIRGKYALAVAVISGLAGVVTSLVSILQ